jgi:hypothetical protein
VMDGLDDQRRPVAILDIGGAHLGADQQTAGIGNNVAFTAFDLFSGIVTTRPAALGGLDRLTDDDPRRRAGFTTSRACSSNAKLIFSNKPASHPL